MHDDLHAPAAADPAAGPEAGRVAPAAVLVDAVVRDRAVAASALSFTVSDPHLPDAPLVYVNPAFERTTGYGPAEALGRNCRFLQGEGTDPAATARIRAAMAEQRHEVVTLLNYRRDGSPFWNELSLSPVHDSAGALTHFVGIQADVTARVLAEQGRAQHLAAEQQARAAAEHAQALAERAQQSLALLAEATSMLAATLDVEECLRRLGALVVPFLADWCTARLLGHDGEPDRTLSTHSDERAAAALARLDTLGLAGLNESSATRAVLAGGGPVLVPEVTREMIGQRTDDQELLAVYDELGFGAAIVVPLYARDRTLGSLTLMSRSRTYDSSDLALVADLARRAALTVDNARLYEREHRAAEQLQRSLLPRLLPVEGLDAAARYLPGSSGAQVGGDWYDLFALPDGTVGLAIGDVMGHDLSAAAAMGQLRSVLRSYAWQGDRPALVLDHLDQLVQGLSMAQLATCVYARLTRPDGGPGTMVLANAGHLPPVLRSPDGKARLLTGGRSLLVGVDNDLARDEVVLQVEPGSLLVLYTDGLVEHRGLDPDEGLERLRVAVEQADGTAAEPLADQLLATMRADEQDDDVALLVVRVL